MRLLFRHPLPVSSLLRGVCLFTAALLAACRPAPEAAPPSVAASAASGSASAESLKALARQVLVTQRQIIVLMSGDRSLPVSEQQLVAAVGQTMFHEQLGQVDALVRAARAAADAGAVPALEALLDQIESEPDWMDADRLAFKEPLARLSEALASSQSLAVLKLVRRMQDDQAVLAEVERAYDQELKEVFGRFAKRGIELKREKWADYLGRLQRLYKRDQILKEHGTIVPYLGSSQVPAPGASAANRPAPETGDADAREVWGRSLPPKTVVLTFDDGPHPRFTDEILDILARYDAPGIFFQLGRNLGAVDAQGQVHPGAQQAVAKRVLAAGHVLANHSFSHGLMAKMSDEAVQQEAAHTEALLNATGRPQSLLFRFPYGARTASGLQTVEALKLRSMMWNIDSLDWADPVPKSIAQRVLTEVDKHQRGVILFHDIHGRTAQALPLVLDQLVADGYRFATWRDGHFVTGTPRSAAPGAALPTGGEALYRDSHALIIGIDQYAHWPRLAHARRDAQALQALLVQRLGFAADKVTTLLDEQATRANILRALQDKLADPKRVKRDDRVLVFFAGHGGTRQLASGREVGYLMPVDASTGDYATDAISMPQLQELAESLTAKHALFIIDACYSGLGLTRGGAGDATSQRFLADNARRIGRQMMTAGGADQQVADDGPGGHSVFTWTLLQALGGKADLNGDGYITGTELAAYVGPAVAGISRQTPAFGSLPGSAGGEFVFAVPAETDGLSADTRQLDAAAGKLAQRQDQAQAAAVAAKPGSAAGLQIKVAGLDGGQALLQTPAPAASLPPRVAAQRWNDKGLALYRERRYDEADAAFTEALKLQPRFALAANNLGFLYMRRGKPQEAARWLAQAVEMDPTRALAYLNLGDAQLLAGDDKAARQAYDRFVALSPRHARVPELQAWLADPGNASVRPKVQMAP